MSKRLLQSTAIVSAMTLLSRISGFLRDLIVAQTFGASAATDAFFVAFRIPNLFRRLFAEGAFSQAFVPVLAEAKAQHDPAQVKALLDRTGGTLAIVLLVVTIAGMVLSPWLVDVFAPGFRRGTAQYELTVEMLRVTFPYLFFISLTAFSGATLNSYGRFAIPAVTPVWLNLAMIGAAWWLAPRWPEPIVALAWGVLIAGIMQFLFQWPWLAVLRLAPRMRWGFHDAVVRRIMKLMVPALFGASVAQVNLLVNTVFASLLATGSVSWLYYSDRLVEFPTGMFGVALGTVILPNLSQHHAERAPEAFRAALDWALRWALLIGVPATIGLMLLAEPLMTVLFQHREFTAYDVDMAARSLRAYSLGVLAFFLVKVLVPGFTARQDTRTPVRFGITAVVANMAMTAVLVWPLQHVGLALAAGLASYVNAALLFRRLRRDDVYRPLPGWGRFGLRVLVANAVLAAALYELVRWVTRPQWVGWRGIMWMAAAVLGAVMLYAVVLLVGGLRPRHVVLRPDSGTPIAPQIPMSSRGVVPAVVRKKPPPRRSKRPYTKVKRRR